MTVKELIEVLESMPQDKPVLIRFPDRHDDKPLSHAEIVNDKTIGNSVLLEARNWRG